MQIYNDTSNISNSLTSIENRFSTTAKSAVTRLPVDMPDGATFSGSYDNTGSTVLFTTSMVGYESINVTLSKSASNTVRFEMSNDLNAVDGDWILCNGLNSNVSGTINALSSHPTDAFNVTSIQFPRRCLYFRARVTAYANPFNYTASLSKNNVITVLGTVSGNAADGYGLTGSLPFGIAAESRATTKSSVNSGAYVRMIATQDGRLVVRPNSIPQNEWQYAAASGGITNTTDVALQAAAGSGIKNYLTGLSIANANATATEVVVKDGSTVIWRMYLAANAPIQSIKFVTPLQSSANAALNVACITTGSQTYINAQGYKAP